MRPLRGCITRRGSCAAPSHVMRRAYPQHLTANGQVLPAEILQVIFPLTYWDSIKRNAAARGPRSLRRRRAHRAGVDVRCQGSIERQRVGADADRAVNRPQAGAYAGHQALQHRDPDRSRSEHPAWARSYFSRLIEQFGGTYYALASYNAGESRVVRWKSERPGLDQDEFIDDIPFPETQNYVKRILGTAEDYRLLYGKGGGRPIPPASLSSALRRQLPRHPVARQRLRPRRPGRLRRRRRRRNPLPRRRRRRSAERVRAVTSAS